jgi:hypothetical protein
VIPRILRSRLDDAGDTLPRGVEVVLRGVAGKTLDQGSQLGGVHCNASSTSGRTSAEHADVPYIS